MSKILVVDDEEDQEELIVQRFEGKSFLEGYDFIFARNGLEALGIINTNSDIEIALIDINMPEMDGLSLLEKIREQDNLMRVLMVSAYGDMSNIRSAMNKGAYDFLTKPIDLRDLEITLKKTLDQVRQIKASLATEQENQALKEKAAELEMQALRAQMNPHFIFNSLNSINNFILKNDKAQASAYLIKFSKLIRMILENSSQPLISLGQELEALTLYIDMESLRFHQHFTNQIEYSEKLDTTSIKVPPLIFQPFVENAIHHGLMPKESPGHLSVKIQESGDRLFCTIRDDGIGREKAGSRTSGNPFKHKSLGMQVTRERISLLDHDRQEPSVIEIHDLVDATGNAAGTEILIQLPLLI